MASVNSINEKIQNLITSAQAVTEDVSNDLTSQVGALIKGYGAGGIDTSSDTVAADKMLEGTTAHDASGEPITGTIPTLEIERPYTITQSTDATIIPSAGKYVAEDIAIMPALQNKTITENGEYTPDDGFVGLRTVTVNVESSGGVDTSTDTVTPDALREGITAHNASGEQIEGTIPTYDGAMQDGLESYPKFQEKTVTKNGEVVPDEGFDGLSKVTVNVPSTGGGATEECDFAVYNGTVAPNINDVWLDKESYPYGCLSIGVFEGLLPTYMLTVSKSPFVYDSSAETCKVNSNDECVVYHYVYVPKGFMDAFQMTKEEIESAIGKTINEWLSGVEVDGISPETDDFIIFWTNTDILNDDNSIYPPASEPSVYDFMLYGDYLLPPLPKGMANLPYRYICKFSYQDIVFYLLYMGSEPLSYKNGYYTSPKSTYLTFVFTDVWSYAKEGENPIGEWYFSDVVNVSSNGSITLLGCEWANTDILNEDGSVYRESSEPTTIHPLERPL